MNDSSPQPAALTVPMTRLCDIAPQPCGQHHPQSDGHLCCCGDRWTRAMTCHPCRQPGHQPGDCIDGGRTQGAGRWCSCQHQPPTAQATHRPVSGPQTHRLETSDA